MADNLGNLQYDSKIGDDVTSENSSHRKNIDSRYLSSVYLPTYLSIISHNWCGLQRKRSPSFRTEEVNNPIYNLRATGQEKFCHYQQNVIIQILLISYQFPNLKNE